MSVARYGFLGARAPLRRERLPAFAREVGFPAETRVFEGAGPAHRFRLVRSGLVAPDIHAPGRRATVVEKLGEGELRDWSRLFEPYRWRFGARCHSGVTAFEFDAEPVRAACEEDAVFGLAVPHRGAEVIARRPKANRIRLPDAYGPPASGGGTS